VRWAGMTALLARHGEARSSKVGEREVAGWRRSGLSAKAYASGRGLKASTLAWWAWKLRREKVEPTTALVPVEVVHDLDADVAEEWEVVTVEGHRLRGDGALTPVLAAAIVAALVGAR
jgi:hypothetical protein